MSGKLKNIAHVHIPKAGGSWLAKVFRTYAPLHTLEPKHTYLSEQVPEQWRTRLAAPPARYFWDDLPYRLAVIPQPSPAGSPFMHSLKVSSCRNPFDHLVSMYHFRPGGPEGDRLEKYVPGGGPTGWGDLNAFHGIGSFEDFIHKWCDPDFRFINSSRGGLYQGISPAEAKYFIYYQMFTDDGLCGIDYIFKSEYFASGVATFLINEGYVTDKSHEELEVELQNFKRVNTSADNGGSRKKKDYRSFYTDAMREKVEVHCLPELKMFGYNFDGPVGDDPLVDPKRLLYIHSTTTAAYNLEGHEIVELSRLSQLKDEEHGRREIKKSQHSMCDLYWKEGGRYHLRRRSHGGGPIWRAVVKQETTAEDFISKEGKEMVTLSSGPSSVAPGAE